MLSIENHSVPRKSSCIPCSFFPLTLRHFSSFTLVLCPYDQIPSCSTVSYEHLPLGHFSQTASHSPALSPSSRGSCHLQPALCSQLGLQLPECMLHRILLLSARHPHRRMDLRSDKIKKPKDIEDMDSRDSM